MKTITNKSNLIFPIKSNNSAIWFNRYKEKRLRGIEFNGMDQYGSIPDNPNLNFGTGDFSVCVYADFNDKKTTSLFRNWNSPAGFALLYYSGNTTSGFKYKIRVVMGNNPGQEIDYFVSKDLTGKHFITYAADRDGYGKLYADGVLIDSRDISSIQNIALTNSDSKSFFTGGAVPNEFFSGKGLFVRLFNKALTEDEINQLWNNGKPEEAEIPYELQGASNVDIMQSSFDNFTGTADDGSNDTFTDFLTRPNDNLIEATADTSDGSGYAAKIKITGSNINSHIRKQYFNVLETNKHYLWEFYYKNVGTNPAVYQITVFDKNGIQLYFTGRVALNNTSTYKKASIPFFVPANGAKVYLYIHAPGNDTGNIINGDEAYYDNPTLIKLGNVFELNFQEYYGDTSKFYDSANNMELTLYNNPKAYVSPVEEYDTSHIIDESGNGNDLAIYNRERERFEEGSIGSLPAFIQKGRDNTLRNKIGNLFSSDLTFFFVREMSSGDNYFVNSLQSNGLLYQSGLHDNKVYFAGNCSTIPFYGHKVFVMSLKRKSAGIYDVYMYIDGESAGEFKNVSIDENSFKNNIFIWDSNTDNTTKIGPQGYLREFLNKDKSIELSNKLLYYASHVGTWSYSDQIYIKARLDNNSDKESRTISMKDQFGTEEIPAYGVWEFDYTPVKIGQFDGNSYSASVCFIEQINEESYTNFRGYNIYWFQSNNQIRLAKRNDSNWSSIAISPNNAFILGENYTVKVTRNAYPNQYYNGPENTFAVWIKGGKYGNEYTFLMSGVDDEYKTTKYFNVRRTIGTPEYIVDNIKISSFPASKNLIEEHASKFDIPESIDKWGKDNANKACDGNLNAMKIDITAADGYVFFPASKADKMYHLRLKAKSDSLTHKVKVGIGGKFDTSPYIEIRNNNLSTTWQEYDFIDFMDTDHYDNSAVRIGLEGNNTGEFYIKDVILEEIDSKYAYLDALNFNGVVNADLDFNSACTNSIDFRIIDEKNKLIYAPINRLMPGTIKDSVSTKNKIVTVGDNRYSEVDLNSMTLTNKMQNGINFIAGNKKYTLLGTGNSILRITLKSPSTGRVLAYTRQVNDDGAYTHTFYVDKQQVDQITSSNMFESSSKCDMPISVEGNVLSITQTDYVLDDLIVDDKIYSRQKIRSIFLSDSLSDTLNSKIKIAGVRNFSNEIIYSVLDDEKLEEADESIIKLAEANKDIKIIKTIE